MRTLRNYAFVAFASALGLVLVARVIAPLLPLLAAVAVMASLAAVVWRER